MQYCISGNHANGNHAMRGIVVNIFGSEIYFLSSHDTALVKLFLIAICAIAAVLESSDLIKSLFIPQLKTPQQKSF